MKQAVSLALIALLSGCATQALRQPDGTVGFVPVKSGKVAQEGMACTHLDYARKHEEIRNKRDATPYEIASLANMPGCVMVPKIGVAVFVYGATQDGTFLRGGSQITLGSGMWVPARVIQLDAMGPQ